MPFWTGDTAKPDTGPSTLRVEPAQVLKLKNELQDIYDEVEEFVTTKAHSMTMQPLGADPVSSDAARTFNENSQAAANATVGYLNELQAVLDALDQAAKTYNLTEDNHAQSFRQVAP